MLVDINVLISHLASEYRAHDYESFMFESEMTEEELLENKQWLRGYWAAIADVQEYRKRLRPQ